MPSIPGFVGLPNKVLENVSRCAEQSEGTKGLVIGGSPKHWGRQRRHVIHSPAEKEERQHRI
jgi:hypothetical protein